MAQNDIPNIRARFSCKPDCVPAAFSGFAGWYSYGFRLESALLQATGECLVCSGRPDGQNPSGAESGKGRFQTGFAVETVIGFPGKPVRTVVYIKKYCIPGGFSFPAEKRDALKILKYLNAY